MALFGNRLQASLMLQITLSLPVAVAEVLVLMLVE